MAWGGVRLWPGLALWAWVGAWGVHGVSLVQGVGLGWSFIWACAWSGAATALAVLLGHSRLRQMCLMLGFPLSWLLLQGNGVSHWLWLFALVSLVWVYPARNWGDAPLFPTPVGALMALPEYITLRPGARVLDAGCGAGDGLRALHRALPFTLVEGVEFSRPLSWLARWRCPWAQVWQGDMWEADWSPYSLVFVFHRPETMDRAWQKAQAEMWPGTYLLSLDFVVPGLLPTEQVPLGVDRWGWLYRIPTS